MSGAESSAPHCRLAIVAQGVVQGVGFRPFVFHAAAAEHLSGWVLNDADGVRIEVQGAAESLARFLKSLREELPSPARIERLDVREVALSNSDGCGIADGDVVGGAARFEIRISAAGREPRPTIPADLATCPDCVAEIFDPAQRRSQYPFTNCSRCGPRWSIVEGLPYDRSRTSMRAFALCESCRAEYDSPHDRRFHAQPIACPACGPTLRLLDPQGAVLAECESAIEQAAAAVLRGEIVALLGLGGFQLLVDATQEAAVIRLRQRKQRPHKPLAVMLPSPADAAVRCRLSLEEQQWLTSPAAPIVLLQADRADAAGKDTIAAGVAPDCPDLGVLLPYTPLHHLLLAKLGRPVVCTSGNRADEPLAISVEEGLLRLATIADVLLVHDRPIVRPVDDSVVRLGADGMQVLRRARGFAPLPIRLARELPPILAVGGHLKNAVAIGLGAEVVVGAHIGDLDNPLTLDVHRRAIEDLVSFYRVSPAAVACDLHPDYGSTRHAEVLAARWGVPLVRVQHHHAHVAACVAEHRLAGPVLGFSWDGVGYGTDGTVWGGETLLCNEGQFSRVAHLRTFALPGGDRAAREPRRAALGVLHELLGDDAATIAAAWFSLGELRTLLAALNRPRLFPRTSSLGRLFDAVAAIVGLPTRISFEGQAAQSLEYAAMPVALDRTEAYDLPIGAGSPRIVDWEPLIRGVLADRASGVSVANIAARFHHALAASACQIARIFGVSQIALTGGCFANRLLTRLVRRRLLDSGFQVYTPRALPPGDGGIAVGQLWVAAFQLETVANVSGNSG